jgi:hypothetical protein
MFFYSRALLAPCQTEKFQGERQPVAGPARLCFKKGQTKGEDFLQINSTES